MTILKLFSLLVFVLLIGQLCSQTELDYSEILKIERNAEKLFDIPVNNINKFAASSNKSKSISNAFDFDDETYWSPESNGKGEWVALYIGELGTFGKPDEVNIYIWDGFFGGGNYDIFQPIKYKVEFFADGNLIVEQKLTKQKDKIGDNSEYRGYSSNFVKLGDLVPSKGVLWMKLTILELEKNGETAIRDIRLSFGNVNPNNAKERLAMYCEAVNQKNSELMKEFTDMSLASVFELYASEDESSGPFCSFDKSLEINLEDTASLFGVAGGEGDTRILFKFIDGNWKLVKSFYENPY